MAAIPVEWLAERAALRLLLDMGGRATPVHHVEACGDAIVEIIVRVTQTRRTTPPPTLTGCQRDILDVLAKAGRRLTKGQILSELEHTDRIHGESTVGFALQRLIDLGFIKSPGRGKRGGYELLAGPDTESRTS